MPPKTDDTASRADDLLAAGASALGLQLNPHTIAAFRAYREELVRWSQRMNLTALATPLQIVYLGFLDSLACAALLPGSGGRVIDIGSGAGFPAIPLALVRADIEFTLVEPSRKKVSFLRHLARQLRLEHVQIVPKRSEELVGEPRMRGAFDVAMARAVAPLIEVGEIVLPFLRPAGVFVAQTGSRERIHLSAARLRDMGLELIGVRPVPPEFGKPGRKILALRKAVDR